MVSRVMEKAGTTVQARAMIYKAVVQTVLLYGSKSWMITGAMMKVLEAFHHHIARRLPGKMYPRLSEERWGFNLTEAAIEAAGCDQ